MSRYATRTEVSTAQSRMEIERTLARYGADQFLSGWDDANAFIGFRCGGRHVRFVLPMPPRSDFARTPEKQLLRSPEARDAAWEQAQRQRWRALALVIKAKLEAVEAGITEFEDEFLAHIVLPDGRTAGQYLRPQIAIAYERGDMPPLLPDYSGSTD